MVKIDDYDRKIIAALQTNGRLSNIDIAGRVNLSHSSCSRRIARLEREGVITGYRALTDRQKLGLSVRAFCGVSRDADVGWEEAAHNLAKIEGVVSVFATVRHDDIAKNALYASTGFRNTGWMIPYVSCAMVGIGLLLHFLGKFLQ